MLPNQKSELAEFVEKRLREYPQGITVCLYEKFKNVCYYDILSIWLKGIKAKFDINNKAIICNYL